MAKKDPVSIYSFRPPDVRSGGRGFKSHITVVHPEPLDRKLALASHRVAMTKPVKQVACVLGFGFVGVIFGFAAALNALKWIGYDTAVRVGPLTVVVAPLIPTTERQAVQLASGIWLMLPLFLGSMSIFGCIGGYVGNKITRSKDK